MKYILWLIVLVTVVIAGTFLGVYLAKNPIQIPIGSVTVGNEYSYATTTSAGNQQLVKNRPAVLGSLIVVKATAHVVTVKNATSTLDVASTTVMTLPASIAVGTYTFDMSIPRGLIIETAASFAGEYIFTYR